MLMRIRASWYGRIAVASPSSVCSRQTNPGVRSASALISGRAAAKSAITGSVISPRTRPMLTWARWNRGSVSLKPSVPLQPKTIRGPPAQLRLRALLPPALPELEVRRIEHPLPERYLAALQPLGRDDVGHDGGLDPDVRGNAGEEMGRGDAEPGLPRPFVTAALPPHDETPLMGAI